MDSLGSAAVDIIYTVPLCGACQEAKERYPNATEVPLDELDTYGPRMYRVSLRARLAELNWSGTAPIVVRKEGEECTIMEML